MMLPEQMFNNIYQPLWRIYTKPKEEKKQLIDNYDKTAHILNISWDYAFKDHRGYCSLCGHKVSTYTARCPFCRAKIEEDCW